MINEFSCNNCPGHVNVAPQLPLGGLAFIIVCSKCGDITYWEVTDNCQRCGSVNNIACCDGQGEHKLSLKQLFYPRTPVAKEGENGS